MVILDRTAGPGLAALAILCGVAGCVADSRGDPSGAGAAETLQRDAWAARRERMVTEQLQSRDITDPEVLAAMGRVPRHRFVPETEQELAYADHPLPIGYRQTISQPYIVAYMTQLLDVGPTSKVLEIGTGSGYQAAVLAELVRDIYTIEIVDELAARATRTLADLGYDNVHVKAGDGYVGWPDQAPFDGIIVTAAPDHVPQPLVDQLAVGAKMVIPVGENQQWMTIITKSSDGISEQRTIPVLFVPMTGKAIRR